MSTLSGEYQDLPVDPKEDRVSEPEPPGAIRSLIERVLRRRRLVVIGLLIVAIAAATVTLRFLTSSIQLGSITITESLVSLSRPVVERDVALDAGLAKLEVLNPAVQGLSLANAHFAPGVRRVSSADGQMLFTTTNPLDAWVLNFAPPRTATRSSGPW
jgi:hypothetical protein